MNRLVVVVLLMFCCTPLHAQQPYTVTRVFGQQVGGDVVYSYDVGGGSSSFTISSPGFIGFRGIEFDRARDRVVVMATDSSMNRLISVDASLDPASMQVLRSGIDLNAIHVDVDPVTGRIYWWENGEILSVGQMGGGTPIVEADNVPAATVMELDVARGFYVTLDYMSNALSVGQLAGTGSPAPTSIPLVFSGDVFRYDIAIEPESGDVLWSEYMLPAGASGDGSAVFRVPNHQPLSTPEAVMGSALPNGDPKPAYYAISAIGDLVASITGSLFFPEFEGPAMTIRNRTTGLVTSEPRDELLYIMDSDYYIAPILVQPVGELVDIGDSSQLKVVVSDTQSSFQWHRNGVAVLDNGRVAGATTDTLSISDAMLSDTDTYTCTVVASNGDKQTSDEVILAVRGTQGPECTADLNGDGVLNFFDVSIFLNAYNAGCP